MHSKTFRDMRSGKRRRRQETEQQKAARGVDLQSSALRKGCRSGAVTVATSGTFHKVKEESILLVCLVCFVCMSTGTTGDVLFKKPPPVRLGGPVTLECELQKKGYKVKQVSWRKTSDSGTTTVATYSTVMGEYINSEYENTLNITTLSLTKTAITIWKTQVSDEGNYSCIFSVFTLGAIQGEMVLSVYGGVLFTTPPPVRLGGPVTLECELQKKVYKVKQVSWRKTSDSGTTTVATYSTVMGEYINREYENTLNITTLSLTKTAITIWKTQVSDEGNYSCIFSVFTLGAIQGEMVLSVYGLFEALLELHPLYDIVADPVRVSIHRYNETADTLTATCIVSGWPIPDVSWLGVGSGHQNGSRVEMNKTATVTYSIALKKTKANQFGENLKCRVNSLENIVEYTIPKQTSAGSTFTPTVIGIVTVATLAIIGGLAAAFCRKKKRGQS
ncbi:uncharacterized protein RCH25_036967 [Pelodytes ibericus]